MSLRSAIPEDQWLIAAREFIECKLNQTQIAEKYGVQRNTVQARSDAHGWVALREEYKRKVLEAPPAQVAEVLAYAERPLLMNGHGPEYFREANEKYIGRVAEIGEMLDQAVEGYRGAENGQEALTWANVFDKLCERQRIIMQIALPAPVRQREKSAKGVTVAPVESPDAGSTSDKV